jgi:NAD(P)H dehydrogenase (quinone)
MYAVMGITGNVGGSTARALLQDGNKVRGIVRNRAKAVAWEAAGVELAVAEGNDADAMESAFRGVEGVFAMIPANFAPAAGNPETRAIVAALRKALAAAQPAKAVYLSSIGAHRESGLGLITQLHILEQEISSLPISNAFVRAAWFLENYQGDAGSARDHGVIDVFLTPPERAIPMVATDDIGRLAAKTLQQNWTGNRSLELEGPARYSPLDAAVAFSRHLNQQVTANPVPRDQWARLFEKQGMPSDRTGPRMEMLDGFNSGWIDFEHVGAEHVSGNRTLEEVLQDLLRK